MPLLKQPEKQEIRGYNLGDYNQEGGSYPAVLLDCLYYENAVHIYTDQKTGVSEKTICDSIFFLFAYVDDNGNTMLASTREMKVYATPKANLIKFLNALRGKETPTDGTYDPCSEIGTTATISIDGKVSKNGRQYGIVVSAQPVPKRMQKECPNLHECEDLIPGGRRTELPSHLQAPVKKMDKAEAQDDNEDTPF